MMMLALFILLVTQFRYISSLILLTGMEIDFYPLNPSIMKLGFPGGYFPIICYMGMYCPIANGFSSFRSGNNLVIVVWAKTDSISPSSLSVDRFFDPHSKKWEWTNCRACYISHSILGNHRLCTSLKYL